MFTKLNTIHYNDKKDGEKAKYAANKLKQTPKTMLKRISFIVTVNFHVKHNKNIKRDTKARSNIETK